MDEKPAMTTEDGFYLCQLCIWEGQNLPDAITHLYEEHNARGWMRRVDGSIWLQDDLDQRARMAGL